MFSRSQHPIRKPLLIIGQMWPLVLLVGHLPGIPRASVNGLPWRLELALTLLLTLVVGTLLIRRKGTEPQARLDRKTLIPLSFAAIFVIWILLSAAWATDRYQALHLGLQWSSYLVFFVLMISAARARVIRSSFITLAIVIWVLAIGCAIESWFGAPLTDASLRYDLKPLLRGSSGFGEITGAACILFAAFALHLNRRRMAFMCGATAVAAWLATLQSLERSPFIGACAGLLLLGIGSFIRPSKAQFWRLGSLTAVLALVFLLQAMPSRLTVDSVPTATRLQQNLSTDPNTRVRFLFWGVGLEMVRAHPLFGVGANNYQVRYGEGRAQFAARYPNSPLVAMNDHLLTLYAHNEYVQMAAELGLVGLILFVLFSLSLVATFVRALRIRCHVLPVLGAAGAMLAFAISSGASASSFRYLGGGLIFFFAAALICRRGSAHQAYSDESTSVITVRGTMFRSIHLCCFSLMLLSVCFLTVYAAGTTLHAWAETSADATQSERYYRTSLQVYPANTAAQFGYGMWLYGKGRSAEGAQYLRSAVDKGFNSSVCFAYLAGAEATAGDFTASERTLATAVKIYPGSVFLLVRHAAALERNGRGEEAKAEFSRALSLDVRAARGWQQLIDKDIDAALVAAKQDKNIALPGELLPQSAVFAVLQENEHRFPGSVYSGWRARMHPKY
jgi:putative inorganic carbon (HCO3(-)) transporter